MTTRRGAPGAQPSDTAVLLGRKEQTRARQTTGRTQRPVPRQDERDWADIPPPLDSPPISGPDTRPERTTREPFGGRVEPASVIGHRSHMDMATRVFQNPDLVAPPRGRVEAAPIVPASTPRGTGDASAPVLSEAPPRVRKVTTSTPSARERVPTGERRPKSPAPAPAGEAAVAAAVRTSSRPRLPTSESLQPSPPAMAPAPAASPEPAPGPRGAIVVFFGCRGGTGSSVIAANLGCELARAGLATCLVDLDLQLGEALTMLGLEAGLPLSSLAGQSVDWDMVSPRLPRHASGLCALSQTGYLDALSQFTANNIPPLLRNLARQFSAVIVDGVRDFNDHALAALDVADRVILVATQDVPAVRGAARRLTICRRLGYPVDKFMLLLNRFDKRCQLTPAMVADEIGLTPSFTVVNDFRLVERAINEGSPLRDLQPQAEITRQIEDIARQLFGLQSSEKKRFWQRLLGRKP